MVNICQLYLLKIKYLPVHLLYERVYTEYAAESAQWGNYIKTAALWENWGNIFVGRGNIIWNKCDRAKDMLCNKSSDNILVINFEFPTWLLWMSPFHHSPHSTHPLTQPRSMCVLSLNILFACNFCRCILFGAVCPPVVCMLFIWLSCGASWLAECSNASWL